MESHNWIINYIANFYVILYINVKTEYRWHLLLDNMELSIIVEQKSDFWKENLRKTQIEK